MLHSDLHPSTGSSHGEGYRAGKLKGKLGCMVLF